MQGDLVVMPDGAPFRFWDDHTTYTTTFHVARKHPSASDDNPGTADRPFATIGRAAAVLQAGERVVVHRGIYRECVRPARGGDGSDRMIWYQAAPGEEIVVRGSEVLDAPFAPSDGWALRTAGGGKLIWMVDLPPEWFVGYNPFAATDMSAEYTTFTRDWSPAETRRQQLRRGMVFADGRPLAQVNFHHELADVAGAFWVEDPGLRLHVRLWDDADPDGVRFEVTTREQVFAPAVRRLGYIRVSGFRFEHAADGVPVPQRSMVSASRGHHWIVEDNVLRFANAGGLDVGNESWHAAAPEPGSPVGGHVIRRNRVSDCGIVGIQGVGHVDGTLIEHNVVERIGGPDVERIWETAGLKLHVCDGVLIRRNVFRQIRSAPGIWLDYLNRNTRITENVLHDVESRHAAIYLEVSHAPNAIDHNVIWGARKAPSDRPARYGHGTGIEVDTGEKCIVAHNLIGDVSDLYAIGLDLVQAGRIVGGRVGLCRDHRVLNNLIVGCPKRIFLSRAETSHSDGNLFDEASDAESLAIEYPAPPAVLNLEAWREHYGFDRQGAQARILAAFDPSRLKVTLEVAGELPEGVGVPEIGVEPGASPGPFELRPGLGVYWLNAGC